MADDLIKTARALDDASFKWRVKAACLNYAWDSVKAGGTGWTAGDPNWNMALYLLTHPDYTDPSMIALVAVDDVVAAAITISNGTAVDTRTVPDDEIKRVVASSWQSVAMVRYKQNPLAGPPQGVGGVT